MANGDFDRGVVWWIQCVRSSNYAQPRSNQRPTSAAAAPIEYAGQWVAWNKAQTEIVSHGPTFGEVYAAANAAGHTDAIYESVRRPGIFIGAIAVTRRERAVRSQPEPKYVTERAAVGRIAAG